AGGGAAAGGGAGEGGRAVPRVPGLLDGGDGVSTASSACFMRSSRFSLRVSVGSTRGDSRSGVARSNLGRSSSRAGPGGAPTPSGRLVCASSALTQRSKVCPHVHVSVRRYPPIIGADVVGVSVPHDRCCFANCST